MVYLYAFVASFILILLYSIFKSFFYKNKNFFFFEFKINFIINWSRLFIPIYLLSIILSLIIILLNLFIISLPCFTSIIIDILKNFSSSSTSYCLGFDKSFNNTFQEYTPNQIRIIRNEIQNVFEVSPYIVNSTRSLFGNSLNPINGPFTGTPFEILNKKLDILIGYHYPLLECFNFPIISKLNFYNLNFLNIFDQSIVEFESLSLNNYQILDLLTKKFPLNSETSNKYINQLNFIIDRNSLFLSQLYLLHNKTCNSFLFFDSDLTFKISKLNKNINIILSKDIITHIKSFILIEKTVSNEMLKLNEKIFDMSLFLYKFNLKINSQIKILNSTDFSKIDIISFKNLFNFQNNEDNLPEPILKLYSNLNKMNIQKTNNSLDYIYKDIIQKEVRLKFKTKSNLENYIFLKNYNTLNYKILKKGLIVDLHKSKYLSNNLK